MLIGRQKPIAPIATVTPQQAMEKLWREEYEWKAGIAPKQSTESNSSKAIDRVTQLRIISK